MFAPRPQPTLPMPTHPLLLLTTVVIALALSMTRMQLSTPTAQTLGGTPVVAPNFGKLPLSFVPNAGQTDPAVRFQVRGMGGTIFFTDGEVVLALPATQARATGANVRVAGMLGQDPPIVVQPPTVVRMQFVDAALVPTVAGAERLPGVVNYLIGSDPARWRTNLPTYADIVYQHLYDGIELRYNGAEGQLKGTYTVAPDADPALIAWRYAGAERVSIDDQTGDLVIQVAGGTTLREQTPVAWQTLDGQRTPVAARYQLADAGRVGFALDSYDPRFPLVIDPTLVYSTNLGGSGAEQGRSIAVDSAGNAYITGETSSMNFPTVNTLQPVFGGTYDAFVAKLNPEGSALLYSTYLGGSGEDGGQGIAVDGDGNAYLTGHTYSINFPIANALQSTHGGGVSDAFVTKLNPAGSTLLYSTYLGGSGDDFGTGIAVDIAGSTYITGWTYSTDFPTVNAFQPTFGTGCIFCSHAFVGKLNLAGNALLYSTYIGGSSTEHGSGIAIDSVGNAYITGYTQSGDFPTFNAFQPSNHGGNSASGQDAFVAKLNPAGSALLFSTYLGGTGDDWGSGITIDGIGNVHVTGTTSSANFPTANALQPAFGGYFDAFVATLNPTGSALLYSTYLGGNSADYGQGITADSTGNAYITGATSSTNFPTANALQLVLSGIGYDTFVLKLNPAGSTLLFSTYLNEGGSDGGQSIGIDSIGNAYITGDTTSAGISSDVFVAKINDPPPISTPTSTVTATSTATPTSTTTTPVPPLSTATPTHTTTPTSTATPTSVPPPTATALPTPPPSANPYEPNDTCAQAGQITPDGSVQQHSFATPGDTDWVRFDASAGTPYRIEVQIPATSPADVALELYAQCGGSSAANQDYTFAPGVQLDFTAPASGPIFLKLVNHTPASAGPHVSYDLSVRAPQAQAASGALILVAGRLRSSDPIQANIQYVTNAVYARFTEHGYTTDRITYLAPDLQLPGVDALATRDNLHAAITQWALDKVGPNQALTLYLTDHGSSSNGFYLDEPRSERLSPTELAGWIAELEVARPGVQVNIIIEACYSGTFIPALSKAGRVVITSTGRAQVAYVSPQGAFFSDPFVAAMGSGSSLYTAFQQGRAAVLAAQYYQSPALDDNGNGQANDGGDGTEAQRRGFAFAGTLGNGPEDDARWPPYISEVHVDLVATGQGAALAGTGQGRIRARVQDNGGVHSVWAVIYPPDYQPPAPSEGLVKETLPTVQLLDQGDGWYAATYPGFTAFGGYRVTVFADDRAEQLARPAAVELQTGFRVFVPLLAR